MRQLARNLFAANAMESWEYRPPSRGIFKRNRNIQMITSVCGLTPRLLKIPCHANNPATRQGQLFNLKFGIVRTPAFILLIALCHFQSGCSILNQNREERQKLTASVDHFCEWTGLKRTGPIADIKKWSSSEKGCNVYVDLKAENITSRYIIRFEDGNLLQIEPMGFSLANLNTGLGYNNVNDPKTRSLLLASVRKLNAHLKWNLYGKATILKDNENYVVTFLTIPPAEVKKSMALDPYVSFVVTPRGTIYAIFLGA